MFNYWGRGEPCKLETWDKIHFILSKFINNRFIRVYRVISYEWQKWKKWSDTKHFDILRKSSTEIQYTRELIEEIYHVSIWPPRRSIISDIGETFSPGVVHYIWSHMLECTRSILVSLLDVNRTHGSRCNAKTKMFGWIRSQSMGSPWPHQSSFEFRFREPLISGDLCGGTESRSGLFAKMWDVASSMNNNMLSKSSSASNRRHITIENCEEHAAVTPIDDRCGIGVVSGSSVWRFIKWYEAHLFPMTNVLRASEGFLA